MGVTVPNVGSMNGTATAVPGVERFVVRYATAARWKAPVVATTLNTLQVSLSSCSIPAYPILSASLPPVCPQLVGTTSSWEGDEDCLYMVLYVPQNPKNIITWFVQSPFIVCCELTWHAGFTAVRWS